MKERILAELFVKPREGDDVEKRSGGGSKGDEMKYKIGYTSGCIIQRNVFDCTAK